jgi:hypothetical protein
MIDKVCLLCVLSTYVYHLSILYPFVLKIKYYTPSQVEWSMIQIPQATLLIQEERRIINLFSPACNLRISSVR